jgi:polyhydroxybutyrate depolymerase
MKFFSEFSAAKSLFAGFILFAATAGSIRADNTPEYTMKCGGLERIYRLHLPDNLPENAPLVIVLHGYGGPDPGILNETADRHQFAACYPQGEKDGRGKMCWNVGYPFQHDMMIDDVEFLTQLVRHLQDKHGFSRHNVFCVGMSNGGEMCYQLATQRPGLFAAVAPVAGLMLNWLYKCDSSTVPVSLFEIHGTEDKTSAWLGDPENKGGWGEYLPVPLAVHFCAAKNRCTVMQTDTLTGKAPNCRKIIKHRFSGGINDSEVWLYEIVGGGHSWGRDDLDTNEELWKFFSRFIKP